MQINIYPQSFKVFQISPFQKNLSTGKPHLAPVLCLGGIPINFGSVSVSKSEPAKTDTLF